jgi:hypothetical protein
VVAPALSPLVSVNPDFVRHESYRPIELEALLEYRGCADSQVPWWKVALLDLREGSAAAVLRWKQQTANISAAEFGDLQLDIWEAVVTAARKEIDHDVEWWLTHHPERCRQAALTCTRAFTQLADLTDDDLNPLVLRDFHVRAIRYMRTVELAVILFPFAHGKSACSSLTVPLLDWVENPEATQLRIYRTKVDHLQWTRKLMDLVENSDHLHALTRSDQYHNGWLNRPSRNDPCSDFWSTEGFSIAGKQVVDPSFRPLTIGGSITGKRADRNGVDDIEDEKNSSSAVVMDRHFATLRSGVFTARRHRVGERWASKYGTVWGTAYLVGTPFERTGVNYRMATEFEQRIARDESQARLHRVMRVSVYPRRDSREHGEVIWPEHRPFSYIRQLEESLEGAFRMRCECLPGGEGTAVFDEQRVRAAVSKDFAYGVRPEVAGGVRMMIGYDPAIGKRTSGRKFPAAVALGYNPDSEMWYWVRYERWRAAMPDQVRMLARWASELDCPVCVETNNIQESYADWLEELYGHVEVLTQYTSHDNKFDRDDGVESWKPLFEHDRVIIHGGDVPRGVLGDLLGEMIHWPGRYRDLVMASWIAKHKLKELLAQRTGHFASTAPEYVRGRGNSSIVDLRSYR